LDRRAFLKTAAAGALAVGNGIAAPAIAQRADARTLRLVPHADLTNFDPIWSGSYIARNAGLLVWDTLYGVDAKLQPQRQMVESEETSLDGLVWTFRLRPGLKFHDGEPVLAKDAVASINRWAAREPMGGMIKAFENELATVDDRTFRWSLKKPYPKMLLALGKIATPCCFIMPARVAATDPFKQISEHVGSGPMRFAKNEWVPGARSVFERFPGYEPRPEPASWLAGGKRVLFERIEWLTMPDPATASAAMQNGEIDWWEVILPDAAPVLRKNRNVLVDIADPQGTVGYLVMNHLHPPFNDVRARRAILMAMSQEDYMHAYVGDDEGLWKPMPSYFTPGSQFYTEEGGDLLKGPRNLDGAKRLLAESGHRGETVTFMAAQDLPHHKAWGDVTVDLLQRLGMKVDFAAVDMGTVFVRRTQKAPPGQGGWQMYLNVNVGVDFIDPSNKLIRSRGDLVANGWSTSAAVEAEVEAWYAATSIDDEKRIARRLNKAAFDHVVYAPLGMSVRHFACRKNLAGVGRGPIPLPWGVSKTA
jgi:peptide/nickel transport system substrate-binding protein